MDLITVIKAIPTIVATGVQLQAHLKQDSKDLERVLNECHEQAEALKNVESTRHEIKNTIDYLKLAVYKYFLYVDSVDDVFRHGRDRARMSSIKEGIERGDYRELREFTEQLTGCLAAAEGYYQESMKAFQGAQTSLLKGAEHCRIEAGDARSKERTTKVVGGTVAAGAIAAGAAGGVALSVVAGVFTFGIGTIVGLSLTAASSMLAGAAVGTGVGVATHLVASDFSELEKKYLCLSMSLNEVHSFASSVLDDILYMKAALLSISTNVDTAKHVTANRLVTSTLHIELDRLYERFDACYNQSSQCRHGLKEVHDKFKHL